MTGQDLDQLRLVASVVALGSFTAAAAARGVTQPAVSMQVRQFEARLGVRLIERIGRKAQPTAAGRELVGRLAAIEEAMTAATDTVAPYRDGHAGRIRLGTGATACIYLLPPLLRRLRERMPGVEIVVRTANTPDILHLVEENALDLGLVTLPARHRALEIAPLLEDELVAIFPVDSAPGPGAVSASTLAARPIAVYEPGGETRRLIDEWLLAGGVRPRPIMELGSIEAIKKLVGAGLCAAVVPSLSLGPEPQDLVSRPLAPRASRMLGLVIRRDKRLDRGLREMLGLFRSLPNAKRAGPIVRTGP
ncbi:LysR family transcriptional regulator [Enterovirga rhinocerotis]|uniref:DNA-binding transcriptional LysR family regulator n=1 Tax=Enterovirga rhinocerotis TaxID=1339210 RepID=A0A4R7BU75_9HYPH|nr:LysR family transcriptional regulator [Enterovirga rhinocerotis]TDR89318.1 DNA-binding transcriptional LysR family regulator [Enterovirga rhinocerotis]